MSKPSVNLVSAFGRGETLALALFENGFQVRVLDFTAAFPAEYQRGAGPFPIVDKAFFAAQREFLNDIEVQPQGLTLWLKDGPIELTGPFSGVHIHSHAEIQAWKTDSSSGDFGKQWLQHFLKQWSSPYFSESWSQAKDKMFPAELPLGNLPAHFENHSHTFERLSAKNIEVLNCGSLRDVQVDGSRILGVEADAGQAVAFNADHWVWCLSGSESENSAKRPRANYSAAKFPARVGMAEFRRHADQRTVDFGTPAIVRGYRRRFSALVLRQCQRGSPGRRDSLSGVDQGSPLAHQRHRRAPGLGW